jgi:hypothetical protein
MTLIMLIKVMELRDGKKSETDLYRNGKAFNLRPSESHQLFNHHLRRSCSGGFDALMMRDRLKLNSITNDLLTLDGVLLLISRFHNHLQTPIEAH